MSIIISLTPAESKRLIGKAVAIHPLVSNAMRKGNIYVSNGTTTGYFVEELLDISFDISKFPCGAITQGVLCKTPDNRIRPILIKDGELIKSKGFLTESDEMEQCISQLKCNDVYVKGANAIDGDGNAGFLLARPNGGNIMYALHQIYTQGVKFIIPVGLEKLINSVPNAHRHVKGINAYTYSFGKGCGYVSVNNGIIIDEIVALELLTGVSATHIASGGIGGSEGAVILDIEGTKKQEENTIKLLNSIKGEPAIKGWKMKCVECEYKCKYRFKDTVYINESN